MQKGSGATRRPKKERWTKAQWHTDMRRMEAIRSELADSGRDVTEVDKLLRRLRENYMRAKPGQGYEYQLALDDVLPLGTWKRYQVPTPAQRKKKFEQWRAEYLPTGKLNPEVKARSERYEKVPDEMNYLERVGAYGPQGPRRRGKPSAGIPAALVELRGLFDRQHGQQPVWEYVATLARLLFPEELGPDFDRAHAENWAKTYRKRHLSSKQLA